MDRKIVELSMGARKVKHMARSLHVSKSRVRKLRERAKEYGYLDEQGGKGSVVLPAYPAILTPYSRTRSIGACCGCRNTISCLSRTANGFKSGLKLAGMQ